MKKTTILVVALVLSLIANIWLGVQFSIANSRTVTAMASVAAAEQTASSQGAELSELTQKLADAEAKTQAVQAELDKITMLQEEQMEAAKSEKFAAEQEAAKAKLQEQQKKDREEAAKKEQEQKDQEAASGSGGGSQGGSSGSGNGGNSGNQSGGQKEPAGGIMGSEAGKMVAGGVIVEVGDWNPEMGAWWATSGSGAEGWLFPNGSFVSGW